MILSPILISLKVATVATLITTILATLSARIMTTKKFKYAKLIETLITLPMVLPPSTVGYILLLVIGINGFVGSFFYETFGIRLIFSYFAAVLASVIVTFPIMYQNAKSAFLSRSRKYEIAARTMGASELKIFFKISIPMGLQKILSGIILTFSRSLGEFGATLMVAGNIPGKTQTLPIALYFAAEAGDQATANKLLIFILALSFSVIFLLNYFSKEDQYA